MTLDDLGTPELGRLEGKAGEFWTQKNPDHFYWLTMGRLCHTILVVVCTAVIYFIAKEYYGLAAGVLASILWIFCPYILGHGALITSDVLSALGGLLAVYCFRQWLQVSDFRYSFISGISLGLAELTKFTLLIFYPLFLLICLIDLFFKKNVCNANVSKQIFVSLLTLLFFSILVINMGYLFEDTGKPLGKFRFQTTLFTGCENLKDIPSGGGNRFRNTLLAYVPVPFPASFVQGIDMQRLDFERGLQSYLRGEWSKHGWLSYYLYALLIKTPLGTLALFVLAIACSFSRRFNASWRDEMVILLPGLTLLAFVSSQTGFSVHSRYVIPVLPFFFIWMSKVGKCFTLRKRFLSIIVSVLLVWSIASSLWIYPYSISYFNELAAVLPTPLESRAPQELAGTSKIVSLFNAGARNGGRHLLQSNIDWGQDVLYLERWCQRHSEITEICTALSGSYPLEQTRIPRKAMPSSLDGLLPGWYAMSVDYLYSKDDVYRQFLDIQPTARIGYSIYIYHITAEEVERFKKKSK
ncbi:MAG: glycosyltransferase family 39 protein [Planctomycetaceae bacterium]|nr:glycosyltransferase family 39 protein [Planctomycetaceae bacterium]